MARRREGAMATTRSRPLKFFSPDWHQSYLAKNKSKKIVSNRKGPGSSSEPWTFKAEYRRILPCGLRFQAIATMRVRIVVLCAEMKS
jgi:hypothetical protein